MKCPLCNGKKGTKYRFPVMVPVERPYERVYEEVYVYHCYDCDNYFTDSKFDPN